MKVDWSKVEQPDVVFSRFPSRRSIIYGSKGVVAASQPLAVEAGLEILRKGGNAGVSPCQYLCRVVLWLIEPPSIADAAVATSAALNVTEPCSCGIGGYVGSYTIILASCMLTKGNANI